MRGGRVTGHGHSAGDAETTEGERSRANRQGWFQVRLEEEIGLERDPNIRYKCEDKVAS